MAVETSDALAGGRLVEPLAALSLVSDLARGRPAEEAMRACLLATALGHALGLSVAEAVDVYFTTLLRSVGCTATSYDYATLFGGDDVTFRARGELIDPSVPREGLGLLWNAPSRGTRAARLRAFVAIAPHAQATIRQGARADCEVGSLMARRFGLPVTVEQALRQVFERWDGHGSPDRVAGPSIALPTRIAAVAWTAVIFATEGGPDRAREAVARWSGGALDPGISRQFLSQADDLLAASAVEDPWIAAVAAEPGVPRQIHDGRLDDIARGFADAVDLKSPYLLGHSSGVSDLAERAGRQMGLAEASLIAIRRAGLLHDLGRVGIASGIWDRRGSLTTAEWEQVRLHPYHSERILGRCPALAPLARLAGLHHERIDGSGYHRGAPPVMLDGPARLLAAADVFHALTEDRPHRPGHRPPEAARLLEAEALDREAVGAVIVAAGETPRRRAALPSGISPRELEVLRLLIRGRSEREIAGALFVSSSTVHTHVVHIYEKAEVSTRAGLAMFAMEHDLVRPGEPDRQEIT